MKIKRGDTVQIMSGKDKGKQGKIEKALPGAGRVVVTGVNLVKKHQKPQGQQQPGGIIEMPAPIDVSNVMIICSACGLRTSIGYQVGEKRKVRTCKQCGKEI